MTEQLETLRQLEQTIRTVATAAGASVVSVGRDGRGTGFVVAKDRVLTSAHNLRDATVSVTFADGTAQQGRVHGADPDGDLVVLDVPTGDAAPLTFADSAAEVGSAVVALSRGGHRARATLGFVSGVDQSFRGPRGRAVKGGIEHTAPLARGSSGGPVLTPAGEVIGVNTHRGGDGFYFARLTDAALQSRITELVDGRSTQRRTLGVAIAPAEVAAQLRSAVGLAARAGQLVRGVDDNGPAAKAGVLVGDLLVGLNGIALDTVQALQDALEQVDTDNATLAVVRGAEELTFTVDFAN